MYRPTGTDTRTVYRIVHARNENRAVRWCFGGCRTEQFMHGARIVPCSSAGGDNARNGSVVQAHCGYDSFRGNVSHISFMILYDCVIWRKSEGDALLNKGTCVSVW